MPTNIKILNSSEINSFDLPPSGFNANERKLFFRPTKATMAIITSFRTSTNKACFVLQLGYFKATNKFFTAKDFHQSEIEFVCKILNISPASINFDQYVETSLERHQKIIFEQLSYSKFTEEFKKLILQEATGLCSSQMKPRAVFMSLIDFLREKKIEVPRYYVLAEIITNAFKIHENTLLSSLEQEMTIQDKKLLDDLLKNNESNLQSSRYKLTALKKSHHSVRPSQIKENIEDLKYFKNVFEKLKPIVNRLNLDTKTIQYYAQLLIKSTMFQMFQRSRNRYLLLLTFIVHQYYTLNDLLTDILIQSSQSALNTALRKHKEYCYEKRQRKQKVIENIFKKVKGFFLTLKNVEDVVFNANMSAPEKVVLLQSLFEQNRDSTAPSMTDEIAKIETDYLRIKDDHYFDILELASIKLQNRVSQIVKHICFDQESSDKKILKAIEYYKNKDGVLGQDAPISFLNKEQLAAIFDDKKKLRISLYKVLFFHKIATAIKSGALNLLYSYKYRAFDDYLISRKAWKENRKNLLKRAGLTGFEDFNKIKTELDKILKAQFKITNENILNQKNPFARFNPNNNLIVTTPKREKETFEQQVTDLFPQDRFFSLFEILSTVNNVIRFSDCLEHWKIKHNRDKPNNKTFFAGIIGLGCNLGIRKISRISTSISQHTLENTVNWYFSNENLHNANSKVLEVTDQLSLPRLYQQNPSRVHTSSDGQKFGIGVDSLHSNYSFKYFGKGKGVSDYTFNDEKHRLFYSTVISSAEREAAYVIDGLTHNDSVKSDTHSTDTHGFTELVFGTTHLLGISFAPRIKDFRKQRLFSFDQRSTFKSLGYKFLPYQRIDPKSIEDQWDNILRLIATIKLKHTSTSQLFRRLSSYSIQHPLYRALKNFGKITKTMFLLKYIDDVDLRQSIEKQLNKTESINKFSKAVLHGNNQEFQQKTKEEQLKTDGCKRLIENVIICWNYLYLSDLIYKTKNLAEREQIIKIIKNGSIVIWQHVNLQGEYDFSDDVLKNSYNFSLPKLKELEIP